LWKTGDMGDRPKKQWVPWGALLREKRELAGLTIEELALKLRKGKSTVSSYERATRTPSWDLSVTADSILTTGASLAALWKDLKRTAALPDEWATFLNLERQAVEIREYQMLVVPGLLQTQDYATALLQQHSPHSDNIQAQARARANRLKELDARMVFVCEEYALRRIIGSPAIMNRQIKHVLDLVQAGRIRMHAIPTSEAGETHSGLSGDYRVMALGDGHQVGYAEHALGGFLVENTDHIRVLLDRFGALQGEALPIRQTVEFLQRLAGEQ
jgi:transcriptional regulator with XRE-family HTH domain